MGAHLRSLVASEKEVSWESTHAAVLSAYEPPGGTSEAPWAAASGFSLLAEPDRLVAENLRVHCPIIRPAGAATGEVLDRVCILLHGLNERGWGKYWDWASAIADEARCAVALFPIAFHMDRSPAGWADFGIMREVSRSRIARYLCLRQSSMANAALSERLDRDPSRFFRSGLMSAGDLGDLLVAIRCGDLPGVAAKAKLGFFGYSIGAYLLQWLTLADEEFAAAGRRFLFCGGPFLSAMMPTSKLIMDSQAHERIFLFWVENLSEALRNDDSLADLVDTASGRAYCAMVDPRYPQLRRREAFSDGATKVASLSGDEVMPRQAVEDFFRDTSVVPRFLDLPAACTHISPFNTLGGEAVRHSFSRLFEEVTIHLFG
jgi:hypothetical protein